MLPERMLPDSRSVPLEGVAQIPDDVERTIRIMGEWALTDEQIARAKDAIWKHATKEIQRRHQAAKLGVRLEQYFRYTPDQVAAARNDAPQGDDSDLELCEEEAV